MPTRSRRLDAAVLIASLLAALALAPAARAQAPRAAGPTAAPNLVAGSAVDLKVLVGFSDTFRLGRWAPITVVAANRGEDVTGTIEVQTTSGNELEDNLATITHRRAVDLPRGSRKRFRFTVHMATFARPLVVRVVAGGREVARQSLDLRPRYTDGRVLLVIGRDIDLDYLNDGGEEGLRVLYPHPDLLPDRWQGYDGVDALVLHETSLESLSRRQFDALEKWIAQGGTFVVSGGPQFAVLRTTRLAALLPAVAVGMIELDDPGALARGFGEPVPAPRPFGVNRVAAVAGRVHVRAGDVPLVIEAARGRGRVFYLTFDVARYPFDRWTGMTRLWLDVLRIAPRRRLEEVARAAVASAESTVLAVVGGQRAGFPGHPVVLVFLVLYLVVLMAGFRMRLADGATRRWVTRIALAAPLVFAPCAYLLFGPLLFPRGPAAVAVSVIEPFPGAPFARLDLELGIYSTRHGPLTFAYSAVDPALRPAAATSRRRATSWTFGGGRAPFAEPDDTRGYRLYLLEGDDVIAYDLRASGEEVPGGVRVRARNESAAMHAAWIVYAGRVHPLGPIPAGRDLDRVLGDGDTVLALEAGNWSGQLGRQIGASFADPALRTAIAVVTEREVTALRDGGHPRAGEALLLGISERPLRVAGESAAWRRSDLTLVVHRFPVVPRADPLER